MLKKIAEIINYLLKYKYLSKGVLVPPEQGCKLQFNLFLEFFSFEKRSFVKNKRHLKPKAARIGHLVNGSHEPVARCQMSIVSLDNRIRLCICGALDAYRYDSRFYLPAYL